MTWRGARLLKPAIQFFLVLLAVYTGLTRISDYRHHPSDVITGYIQGAFTAYWVVSIPCLLLFVHQCMSFCQSKFKSQGGLVFVSMFLRPSTSRPCLKAPAQICLLLRPWTAPCHPTILSAKRHIHQPLYSIYQHPLACSLVWIDKRFEECATISCEVKPHTSVFGQSQRERGGQ